MFFINQGQIYEKLKQYKEYGTESNRAFRVNFIFV